VGNPQAPFLNSVLPRSLLLTNSRAVAHPSQPNYLALFSGSTHGVTDDRCPVRLTGQPNLGQQLAAAGLSFTGYSESMPSAGYTGCSSGRYARKHSPWADFDNVPAAGNQPFSAFPTDFARLSTASFVVPDLCHDMHDCPVATGDAWMRAHLDPYLQWAKAHNSLLVVTTDEDDNTSVNQIFTVVAGASVRPGRYAEKVTHYSVLRLIEDAYGLAPLGAAAQAAPITDIWR
jgi:acid phosphatase